MDFFWSDQHFWHRNAIKHCDRPFDSVEHMNRTMIENYQAVVQPCDTVLWLGDAFISSAQKTKDILAQLHGTNILVRGNHDRSASRMAALGFDMVTDSATMYMSGRRVRLSHFPYKKTKDAGYRLRFQERSPDRKAGEVLIHGHTHSKKKREGNMIHVGVDAWGFRPVPRAEIEALIEEA